MTDSPISSKRQRYLYRIIKFEHLIELFESRELRFSHPGKWDDPYETRLSHPSFDFVAAQCWCKHSVSDAMWRIYSPHQLGVRIKTTREILMEQLRTALSGRRRYLWRIGNVSYKPQSEIDEKVRFLVKQLEIDNRPSKTLSPMFWKRRAFVHEAEVRAVVYDRQAQKPITEARVAVNPHELIRSVLIDPRAPDKIVEMYTYFLRMKIKYSGRVAKSELYATKPQYPANGD